MYSGNNFRGCPKICFYLIRMGLYLFLRKEVSDPIEPPPLGTPMSSFHYQHQQSVTFVSDLTVSSNGRMIATFFPTSPPKSLIIDRVWCENEMKVSVYRSSLPHRDILEDFFSSSSILLMMNLMLLVFPLTRETSVNKEIKV